MTGQEPDVGATPLHAVPLTEEFGGGPDDGFRSLFQATYQPLVAYARRRVSDPAEADDVVAEVYSVAWRRRSELRPGADPRPWLYGIAANVVRNHWRSRARHLRLVDRIGQQPDSHAPPPDPSDSQAAELRSALTALSFDDQEVLRLAAWEGLSHAEIATVLGVTENAVGIRLHRARNRLRQQLAAEISPAPDPEDTPEDRR